MRVLVVEDDAQLARRLTESLRAASFVVEHAADGKEALYLGEVEPFDAIVLDLGLPLLDGLSVLTRWRERGVAVPVLILTARERWSEKLAGFNRQALHAASLSFVHPVTGTLLEFNSPLPEDFAMIVEALKEL